MPAKPKRSQNPSMNTKHILLFSGGVLLGGGIGYVVANNKKTKESAKLGPGEPPQIPDKPSGPGLQGKSYRDPLPSTVVDLPNTTDKRDKLDDTICKVFRSFTEPPSDSDVAMGVMETLVPDVEWPAVQGDNWSLIALQASVGMRVQQIAIDTDPTKTAAENLEDFCPKIAGFQDQ